MRLNMVPHPLAFKGPLGKPSITIVVLVVNDIAEAVSAWGLQSMEWLFIKTD